jgi:hypothetical protein
MIAIARWRDGVPAPVRRGLVLLWIILKLVLVTAMLNRNAAQFIYAGF